MKKSRSLKVGIVSALSIILVFLLIFTVVISVKPKTAEKKIMEEYEKALSSSTTSIIYYYKEDCSFCEMQHPVLDKVVEEYGLEYTAIDKAKLKEEDIKRILGELDIENATPTTVVVKNGEVIARHRGYLEGNKLVDFFVKANVLEEGSTYKGEEYLDFIDYDGFLKLEESKDLEVLVLGQSVCNYCAQAKPILNNISKAYDVEIHYLNLNYLSSENQLKVFDYIEKIGFKEDVTTPTILVIDNNKLVGSEIGLQTVTDYIKFFKETGAIKE